ncbi:FAD-dependent monooxygenase [Acuticoccus sp. MNP-M23]|nr:FAD-dependent monooxygenase [Acuticoccus sp. MNP-M23]WMS41158.1 FAD-dependent monooxygenase [Acuticoccus sp. MNP-M23]
MGRVIVAGGGLVGRTIAVALASQSHLSVTLLAGPPPGRDERASAVAAAGRRLFSRIGVWPHVADVAQPIEDMVITDSRADDLIRPEALSFEGERGAPFAYMVPNAALYGALTDRCAALGITEIAASATYYTEAERTITVELDNGDTITGDVLVAADGRASRLRGIAGIGVVEKHYGQCGIVGTVAHEDPHYGRATQHFLPNGPFAMLPLTGNRSSIVWTERPQFAKTLVEMDPFIAGLEIERVFGLSLGRLTVEAPLMMHPLSAHLARDFARGRLVLAGDAAHGIHPLAGQGLNLGLRDAAALSEVLVDAGRQGEDLSLALPRYARWRRADAAQMLLVTDQLNALFSRRSDLMRAVRSIGLGLVDRRDKLKSLFIQEAAGIEGEIPRLMRGDAL